jgi:hypothetical protein
MEMMEMGDDTRKDFEAVIMLPSQPSPDAVAPATEILAAAGVSLKVLVDEVGRLSGAVFCEVRGATALDKDALCSWLEDLLRPLGGKVVERRSEWMSVDQLDRQTLFATMLVCSNQEATGAKDICHDIVKVIMAWRRGKLLPRWETPHLTKLLEPR